MTPLADSKTKAPSRRPSGNQPGEPRLSAYLERFGDPAARTPITLVRQPRRTVLALRDLLALPKLDGRLGSSVEARAVAREFNRFRSRRMLLGLASVLVVPEEPAVYREGASKQTLRRKVRVAEQHGITWRSVDDPDERRRLVDTANAAEQSHRQEEYRQERPDNEDLLDYRLWMVAESRDGRPLLLAVIPFDGQYASLRYFRTLVADDESSVARYLMTEVLVARLAERGVRYLIDAAVPHWLPNGLRHFQRMLGFRLVRLRLRAG